MIAPVLDPSREQARKRVQKKRDLTSHVVVFVIINGLVVATWALTGRGYFWPAWLLAAWGAGLLVQMWEAWRGPITEADVDAELDRSRR